MATFYSSFFSSGLLAPRAPEPFLDPSTPRQTRHTLPSAVGDPFLPDSDTTPTATEFIPPSVPPVDLLPVVPLRAHAHSGSQSSVASSASGHGNGDSHPRLRRRRSSLNASASPLASIKSPATRQSLFVARARSGSESRTSIGAGANATHGNSLIGRMRSGSVGGAVMRMRRVSRKPAPPLPAPPPTAPLPAPPTSSRSPASTSTTTPKAPQPSLPLPLPSTATTQPPSTPRRPLARRANSTDNTLPPSSYLSGLSLLTPSPSPFASPFLTAADEDAEWALPSSPGGVYEPAVHERLGGAGMQVDYPSPVEGTGSGFGSAMEED